MSASATFARLRRAPAVLLALLIALLGAVAPTLSHALAAAHSAPSMVEVCTSAGSRWVQREPSAASPTSRNALDESGSGPAPSLDPAHCPFCLLSMGRVAPAPHPLVHLFVVLGDSRVPTVRLAFFFTSHFALAPPSRGPPLADSNNLPC